MGELKKKDAKKPGRQYTCVADLDTNFVLHYNRDMKNVTITLKEEVARWVRIRAAEKDTSVSRLVGDMLMDMMQQEDAYQAAMERFFSQKAVVMRKKGEPLPSREDLYDR